MCQRNLDTKLRKPRTIMCQRNLDWKLGNKEI